jgi:hypothetical protein
MFLAQSLLLWMVQVAEIENGTDLVENHIGEKAKVVGTVEQDQEVKIITITSFEIMAE